MLENFYSYINIGSTKVDTRLENEEVRLGSTLKGNIHIIGGKKKEEQQISSIYLYFWTTLEHGNESVKYILHQIKLTDPVSISYEEERTIPFEIDVPYILPITTPNQFVFLSTGLSIEDLPDPKDVDSVTVLPSKTEEHILKEIREFGLLLKPESGHIVLADYGEERFSHFQRMVPFVQVFDYEGGKKFDSFTLYLDIQNEWVHALIEVDSKPHNIKSLVNETLKKDKESHKITLSREEILKPNMLKNLLKNLL